ncbi:MAG: transketolase [Lachnospiraceae bacterium]|nr:transketolase [Lachnospiraceae bacterium]
MDRIKELERIAKAIRFDTVSAIGHLGVGHIGGCLSIVELLTVLYFEAMHIDPADPKKEGRDRFICSKGHAGPAVYATLSRRGYFDRALLWTLNQGGTELPSHCDMLRTPGIDMTTGSLGQGFSCAVGAAIGSKWAHDSATVFTVIGDGESQEGQIWEAAMLAGNQELSNLVAFTDRNRYQLDGDVEDVNGLEPLADKWMAFNWNVIEVEDGNNVAEVLEAVRRAKTLRSSGKPTMVLLRTVKGKGISFVEAMGAGNHNANISPEQTVSALSEILGRNIGVTVEDVREARFPDPMDLLIADEGREPAPETPQGRTE